MWQHGRIMGDHRTGGSALDTRDLRRGALVHLLGQVMRAGHPVLLIAVTRTFGAGTWGVFVAGQAMVMVAARVSLLGLDRGLLYWVPRALASGQPTGIGPAAWRVLAVASLLAMLGAGWGAPRLASSWDAPEAIPALVVLAWSTVPLALMELLTMASVARRRVEAQVVVRELVVPIATVGGALVLYHQGWRETGLAWAYFHAHWAGAVLAWIACRWMLRGTSGLGRGWRLPGELRRHARPLWGADLSHSLIRRVDAVLLGLLAGPVAVGVYGVVSQFGNTIRSLRTSFEPMVLSIVSDGVGQAGGRADRSRVAASLNQAAVLVVLAQTAVLGVFLAFGRWMLPWFGPGFEQGVNAMYIIVVLFGIHGSVALVEPVVNGIGGARASLVAVVAALALQVVLLLAMCPPWGVEGAALAVGLAHVFHGALLLLQLRRLTGSLLLGRPFVQAVVGFWGALGLMVALGLVLRPLGDGLAWGAAFLAFVALIVPGAVRLWRTGSGPSLEAKPS
jgi:O-antigen/teichoic acid export membrane protein